VLLLVAMMLPEASATRLQSQGADAEAGLRGTVLGPDGSPVTRGSVTIARATATIDANGQFRVIPNSAGVHQLHVGVPGFAPYRVNVTVPESRTLRLPAIHLSPPTHFRVRFMTAEGQPVTSPRLRWSSVDVAGQPVPEPAEARAVAEIDGEGTVTVGPLPRGVTMWVLDTPPFALTRLPDLNVTGAETFVDGGTVVIEAGARLQVDIVDAAGVGVPGHTVSLEDARAPSPLSFMPTRTNQQGRATFERVAAGRYRVRTRAAGPCGSQVPLSIGRLVSVAGTGTLRTRIVIGGTATLRLSSPFGPLSGVVLSAAPETGAPSPPLLRTQPDAAVPLPRAPGMAAYESSCGGSTDADGRLVLPNFPPGPARVDIRLQHSTVVQRIGVPAEGREIAIALRDGFLPLRVINAITKQPVAGAAITWTGRDVRAEARATANGEALLEWVGTAAGTLEVTAPLHERVVTKLSGPPATSLEVVLPPSPPTVIEARVVTLHGAPLQGAVVELLPQNPLEIGHVVSTDVKGVAAFREVPPGAVRLTASAEGHIAVSRQVSNERSGPIVFTLAAEKVGRIFMAPERSAGNRQAGRATQWP
jgi:hypothetical protein